MSVSFNANRSDFNNTHATTGAKDNLFTRAVNLAQDGDLGTEDIAKLKELAKSDQSLTLNEADFIANLESQGTSFVEQVTQKSQEAGFDPKSFQWHTPEKSTVPAKITPLRAAKNIDASYDPKAKAWEKDSQLKLGALSTKADRLQALRNLSQVAPTHLDKAGSRTESENARCGPSCILAGALYAEGNPGLLKVTGAMRKFDQKHQLFMTLDPQLAQLEERLKAGTATKDDMAQLQDVLYQTLDRLEEDIQLESVDPNLDNRTIGAFIHESPEIKALFDSQGLEIHNIDNDGDGTNNHLTLALGDGVYYDPMYKGADQQVVDDPEGIEDYADTNKSSAYPLIITGLKIGSKNITLRAQDVKIDENGDYVLQTQLRGRSSTLTMNLAGAITKQVP